MPTSAQGILRFLQPPPALVQPLLDWYMLQLQADTFKAVMQQRTASYDNWPEKWAKAAEHGEELPCAAEHLWAKLQAAGPLVKHNSEYHRLAQLALCQPVGSVDNEGQFSGMNNIKISLRSQLKVPHLNACLRIFFSSHTAATPLLRRHLTVGGRPKLAAACNSVLLAVAL